MVGQAWLFPLARAEGLAFRLQRGLRPDIVAASALTACVLSVALGRRGIVALAVAGLVALGIGKLALRRLGGLNGDVYGATCEMVELCVLLVYSSSQL
jgi:adenosylcobinamide-GDP ribazoletransferase